MPIAVSWIVEKRVLYSHMYGHISHQDLVDQKQTLEQYGAQSEHLLHLINDATDTTSTELGLRDLQQMQFANFVNLGWAIYVTPNKLHRFFASVITQLSGKRSREFSTLDEALHFLQDIDDTLPPLISPIKAIS